MTYYGSDLWSVEYEIRFAWDQRRRLRALRLGSPAPYAQWALEGEEEKLRQLFRERRQLR